MLTGFHGRVWFRCVLLQKTWRCHATPHYVWNRITIRMLHKSKTCGCRHLRICRVSCSAASCFRLQRNISASIFPMIELIQEIFCVRRLDLLQRRRSLTGNNDCNGKIREIMRNNGIMEYLSVNVPQINIALNSYFQDPRRPDLNLVIYYIFRQYY